MVPDPSLSSPRQAVEAAYRSESRRVLATLIRLLGDFDRAEEALHEAFAAAAEQWPRDGVPAQSARLAGLRRPLQGHRRLAPPGPLRRVARRAGGRARARDPRTRRPSRRGSRTTAPARLHLLPPGASGRRAGGAHAARGVRPHHRGDRARLPHPSADGGPAHRAGQGQDPRGAHPLRGPGPRELPGGSRRCCTSSISSSTRATRPPRAARVTRADLSAEAIRLGRLLLGAPARRPR